MMKRMHKDKVCLRSVNRSRSSVRHNPNKKNAPLTQSKAARLPIPSTQLLRFDQLNIPAAEIRLLKNVISSLPVSGLFAVKILLMIGAIQLSGLAAITKTNGKITTIPTISPMPMRNKTVFLWLGSLFRNK